MTLQETLGTRKLTLVVQTFMALKARWKDESEYEDFNKYVEVFEQVLEGKVSKFTSQPWKVFFDVDGYHGYMKIVNDQVVWGRATYDN